MHQGIVISLSSGNADFQVDVCAGAIAVAMLEGFLLQDAASSVMAASPVAVM
jgi:hypothetical protein